MKLVMKNQTGFTLITFALAVVSSGIVLGFVVQGKDLVDRLQYTNFKNEIVELENKVWSYKLDHGRWPGDCNANGIIEIQPQAGIQLSRANEEKLNKEKDKFVDACSNRLMQTTIESENSVFSDLRIDGYMPKSDSNQTVAKHGAGNYFIVGAVEFNQQMQNVIVVYTVPAKMAQWIDVVIDGKLDGKQGRVRRWDENAAGSNWPLATNHEMVSMVYFFDSDDAINSTSLN